MAKVLVIGASRGVGLATVKRALDEGHEVRAMARTVDALPSDAKLERYRGDALRSSDVRGALDGIDVVIQTLGITPRPAAVVMGTKLFSKATRVLVEAMEAARVDRLICLTGFGAGDSRNQGGLLYDLAFNAFLGRVYDDKNVQEHLIRSSELAWTIVRPVILTDRSARGRYRAELDPSRWRGGFISRADVADFLVAQIDDATYLRKAPVLMG